MAAESLEPRDLPKAARPYAEAARAAGWTIRLAKHGYLFYPPDKSKPPVSFSRTTSDHRMLKNFRSQLRRSELEV